MNFEKDYLYHIYNQSNRKEVLFKDALDYKAFLAKVKKWVSPCADILAYCLMPDHFHFLIRANEMSTYPKKLGAIITNELSNGFRVAQSQYAQYFNERYTLRGSIFRPKIKQKSIMDGSRDYSWTCYHYIHQNPVEAGLCNRPSEWHYFSAKEIKSEQYFLVDPDVIVKVLGNDCLTVDIENGLQLYHLKRIAF